MHVCARERRLERYEVGRVDDAGGSRAGRCEVLPPSAPVWARKDARLARKERLWESCLELL